MSALEVCCECWSILNHGMERTGTDRINIGVVRGVVLISRFMSLARVLLGLMAKLGTKEAQYKLIN